MSSYSQNNKRLAKNTLFLYFRMIFLMGISLFTSRIVLEALGEDNFGIYNVVGGVVTMFSILSGSLSSAITRFITYSIGKNDKSKLNTIFSTSVNIQIIMAVSVCVLIEVIGIWFLNNKMNIPVGRMEAANFVLQCSIITFGIDLISIPYNATIVAHEKMNIYAYFSILEAVLKVLLVYLLYISSYDKLKIWAFMLLCVAILMRFLYGFYCKRNFEEAHYRFVLDKSLFKEMGAFAGWNMFGNGAFILNTEGINMLINVFFGVALNAARGLAQQVSSAISQLVSNFTTALNPQITKYYAAGEYEQLYKLICRGSKYSYFLMFFFSVPVILEMDKLLSIWLKVVPAQTAVFARLVIVSSLATVIGNSLLTAIFATGKIKRYQVIVTSIGCCVFPLTWLSYKLGAPAYSTYIIYSVIYFSLNFVRLRFLKKMINFPVGYYFRHVLWKIILGSIIMFSVPFLVYYFMEQSLIRLLLVSGVSLIWGALSLFMVVLEPSERDFIKYKLKSIKLKK